MALLLQVRNLKTYFFTTDGVVHAVDDVSFDLAAGEKLGIVGESGCGKSVTALSLMRLIPQPPGRIVGGTVMFDGMDVVQLDEDELRDLRGNKIAMIFQDPMTSLNPVLTICRQISESLELHKGMSRSQARERTIELLRTVGIPSPETRINDYPHQFSGGMRQRVMIAMALACDPQLLLADEPTTALDVTIQAQILDLVKRLCVERRTSVILITHDLGVLAGMTDRLAVMYAGRIVETAPTPELYANPKHPYTIALMKSVPRLDEEHRDKLFVIDGLPPDLIDPPKGCRFAPRCFAVIDKCWEEMPELMRVSDGHSSACWVDVSKGRS